MTLARSFQKLEKVDFRINNYGFNKSASEEIQTRVKTCLDPFYKPLAADDFPLELDPQTTLNLIIDRLKEGDIKLHVHHNDLPYSVEITQLLTQLQSQLNNTKYPEISTKKPDLPQIITKLDQIPTKPVLQRSKTDLNIFNRGEKLPLPQEKSRPRKRSFKEKFHSKHTKSESELPELLEHKEIKGWTQGKSSGTMRQYQLQEKGGVGHKGVHSQM